MSADEQADVDRQLLQEAGPYAQSVALAMEGAGLGLSQQLATAVLLLSHLMACGSRGAAKAFLEPLPGQVLDLSDDIRQSYEELTRAAMRCSAS